MHAISSISYHIVQNKTKKESLAIIYKFSNTHTNIMVLFGYYLKLKENLYTGIIILCIYLYTKVIERNVFMGKNRFKK